LRRRTAIRLALRNLTRAARLYLLHAALLTFGLALSALYYNLLLERLGYDLLQVAVPVVGQMRLIGLLNSLAVLVAGLSSLPLWWLVSVIGPRAGLVAAAALQVGSLGIVAIWPEPLPLLVGSALSGPGAVLFQVSAAPFMMRHSGAGERDALFSLSAGINVGLSGLGSLVAGFIPGLGAALLGLSAQSADAYRIAFAAAATCVALAVVPLLLVARERPAAATARASKGGPHGITNRAIRVLAPGAEDLPAAAGRLLAALRYTVSPLLISCGAALLIPFLNIYFRQRFAARDEELGVIFAAISIATGAATLLTPLLSARLGKMGSVVLTQALAIPCLLLLGAAPVLWAAVAVAVVRGTLMNMASPLYDAHAMEHTPEPSRPMVIGLINGAFSLGYIVGPNISAEVRASYGFGPLFIATAVCYTCAALANYLLFIRPARQPARSLRRGGAEDAEG